MYSGKVVHFIPIKSIKSLRFVWTVVSFLSKVDLNGVFLDVNDKINCNFGDNHCVSNNQDPFSLPKKVQISNCSTSFRHWKVPFWYNNVYFPLTWALEVFKVPKLINYSTLISVHSNDLFKFARVRGGMHIKTKHWSHYFLNWIYKSKD